LTAYPDLVSAVEGIRHDVDEYFVKPADVDSLVLKIDKPSNLTENFLGSSTH
jgi:ActR/RegA family two-component response regulator